MKDIRKALEKIENKYVLNPHKRVEHLESLLIDIVEGVEKLDAKIPASSKDDYSWGYRIGQVDLMQKVKKQIYNKVGIDE